MSPSMAATHRSVLGAQELDQSFDALVFDWDGTAVPDRQADATAVRGRVEALCSAGVHTFVVSGTHLENIDEQLRARPRGRGRLFVCCNRGSEIFEVTGEGPRLVLRRAATPEEDAALDRAAARTVELLGDRGFEAEVVSQRLNRRKVDLIPVASWSDPKKSDIALLAEAVTERLAGAGISNLAEVVALAGGAARAAGVVDPRITSDVKHIEIGLTDKSDSAGWAATWLEQRGITGGLVLVGGDEFGPIGGIAGSDSFMMVRALARSVVVSVGVEPAGVPDGVSSLGGGPVRFSELLDAQVARRAARRVPHCDLDPAWVLPLDTGREDARVAESLGALGNGFVGVRGSREEGGQNASPLFLVNGVYDDDDHLLPGPIWTGLGRPRASAQSIDRRVLDLRSGTLVRLGDGTAGLRSMRFISVASPYAMGLRAEALAARLEPGDPLVAPRGAVDLQRGDAAATVAKTGGLDGGIAVAARDRTEVRGTLRTVERLAAWVASPVGEVRLDDARQRLAEVDILGFDALLAEHRQAWARRWADAEVVIEGDPESELAARFAVFHLLCAAGDSGESAVGARGLTGDAYAGHVFWDADVFVLPALAAIHPAAARTMLEYRIRRLPAARAAAKALGLGGARFPWESARDGTDVTPRQVMGRDRKLISIATGEHEEHIVADVAWAADCYARWTGDAGFLAGVGRDLVVETARYWASRITQETDGGGHLRSVMGPDEYHEVVDDNAYTNVMARWNLRLGADLLAGSGDTDEADAWRSLAEGLVDGWDSQRGLYEQFAGYFGLEALLMSEVAPPPVAVDMVLGAERVAGSQLIKQADVLMLHHLVPDEVEAGSLASCLAFYEPRTAHGSSLSPAVYASLLARAHDPERALGLFRLAARLDLDNLTGTTAGGIHLATMGGLWQALAFGFLGLRAGSGVLSIDPCLPATWSALGMRLRLAGHPVGIRAEHDRVRITCDQPLLVRLGPGAPVRCEPPGATLALEPPARQRSHR
jgi:trehalose/maltose hydrolase-like predicted phosphorylase